MEEIQVAKPFPFLDPLVCGVIELVTLCQCVWAFGHRVLLPPSVKLRGRLWPPAPSSRCQGDYGPGQGK